MALRSVQFVRSVKLFTVCKCNNRASACSPCDNFQRETRLQRRSLSDSWKYQDLLQQNDPTGRHSENTQLLDSNSRVYSNTH